MTVSTFYAASADAGLLCSSATYLTARSGGGSLSTNGAGATCEVGQYKPGANYYVYEYLCSFDTSAIPDSDVISAAVLSFCSGQDGSTDDFTLEAYAYDWGAAVTTADWVPGASLGGLTKVATCPTTSWTGASATYIDLAEVGSALRDAVDKAGTTRLLLASSQTRLGVANASDEYVKVCTADYAGRQPRLVVTHAPAAGGPDPIALGRRGRVRVAQAGGRVSL